MTTETKIQCDDCDGAGETCHRCGETPDNCECPGSAEPSWEWVECPACNGDGVVDDEDEDEDEDC
jgi:hypothetical protein